MSKYERQLPIVPGCKALFMGGNFVDPIDVMFGNINKVNVPPQEVSVIQKGDSIFCTAQCMKCGGTDKFWDIQLSSSPFPMHGTILTCECTLIRIDGGDFKDEHDKEKQDDAEQAKRSRKQPEKIPIRFDIARAGADIYRTAQAFEKLSAELLQATQSLSGLGNTHESRSLLYHVIGSYLPRLYRDEAGWDADLLGRSMLSKQRLRRLGANLLP